MLGSLKPCCASEGNVLMTGQTITFLNSTILPCIYILMVKVERLEKHMDLRILRFCRGTFMKIGFQKHYMIRKKIIFTCMNILIRNPS